MRLPVIKGVIKRRLLVNFRADPAAVQKLLPTPFRPKLHEGFAIVGVCLIRLEQIRPAGMPALIGFSSENAAHRIAVLWRDATGMDREGVFIPRRDSNSLVNRLAGGRLFPGEHNGAQFSVVDHGNEIELKMRSLDGKVAVTVVGRDGVRLPANSCFSSCSESSSFFEGGSVGYSVKHRANGLDGLVLKTMEWRVKPLEVCEVSSSFFEDRRQFPKGSVEFDHALIMRDIPHEWHAAEDV
ncbi:MAG: DUF2071 domain-containing protein [Verrucomicrobia subdivision 3 bacterium]|nr:DUF2071 domain-containing protein [Limisphaerales bacterium]